MFLFSSLSWLTAFPGWSWNARTFHTDLCLQQTCTSQQGLNPKKLNLWKITVKKPHLYLPVPYFWVVFICFESFWKDKKKIYGHISQTVYHCGSSVSTPGRHTDCACPNHSAFCSMWSSGWAVQRPCITPATVFLVNAKQNKILTYVPNLVISLSPELAQWRMSSPYSSGTWDLQARCYLSTISQAISRTSGDESSPRMKAVGETSGDIPSSSKTYADPVSLCVLVLQVRSGVISVHVHNRLNRYAVTVCDVLGLGGWCSHSLEMV